MGEQIYGALVNIKNIWNVEDVEDMVAANYNILPETWRSKHIDEWELNELQSWIMSLEINNENDKRELVNTIADQEYVELILIQSHQVMISMSHFRALTQNSDSFGV
eukprot:TRINITY_DN9633_c0_g1_i1.p1 TRINITY_DN9633_c0_g1~~TRINITY_DN9633_c0_g1_i1.p1  ORF type:complete len:117 (-),score=18.54 TRINITY_DN9633_c0_g1_i1:184-504(-)